MKNTSFGRENGENGLLRIKGTLREGERPNNADTLDKVIEVLEEQVRPIYGIQNVA